MNAPEKLWRQWFDQLRAVLPALHGHRSKTLAFFVLGVVLAGTARLPRVAEALAGLSAATTPRIERRLARLLATTQVRVLPVWTRLVGPFLTFWRDQRLVFRLASGWLPAGFRLAATPLDARATVRSLGLLVQSRLLPVSWPVAPLHDLGMTRGTSASGSSSRRSWIGSSRSWEPLTARSSLSVDSSAIRWSGAAGSATGTLSSVCPPSAGSPPLPTHPWPLGRHLARLSAAGAAAWAPLVRLRPAPSSSVQLWHDQPVAAQVRARGEPDQPDPWIVVSDRPAGRQRRRASARRMRVESTFHDRKRRGGDREGTVIADRARLDRLLLVVFLGLWWLAHLAASCLHHGQRTRFDRPDRRDKGIFRLGRLGVLAILRRTLTAASLARCLPFRSTPTGWAFSLRF
jgi:hypothetical protein